MILHFEVSKEGSLKVRCEMREAKAEEPVNTSRSHQKRARVSSRQARVSHMLQRSTPSDCSDASICWSKVMDDLRQKCIYHFWRQELWAKAQIHWFLPRGHREDSIPCFSPTFTEVFRMHWPLPHYPNLLHLCMCSVYIHVYYISPDYPVS